MVSDTSFCGPADGSVAVGLRVVAGRWIIRDMRSVVSCDWSGTWFRVEEYLDQAVGVEIRAVRTPVPTSDNVRYVRLMAKMARFCERFSSSLSACQKWRRRSNVVLAVYARDACDRMLRSA